MDRKGTTYITEGKYYEGEFPEINRADINLTQLHTNITNIKSRLKQETLFMAVVKGDAYGHGLVPIGLELERCGCDALGVVRLTEALGLRNAGIKIPVVMLAPIMPKQAAWVVENNITVMVDNERIIRALNSSAEEVNKKVKVHIKVNTGLNRYGVEPEDALNFIKLIKDKYLNIEIEGMYTHFKDAEINEEFTRLQLQRFENVLKNIEKENLRPPIIHAAGSAGLLKYPESHYDMVRCGIILYGLEHKEDEEMLPNSIKPIMTLRSSVLKIDHVKCGETGGYGNNFTAERESKIAIIGIGYGDGVSRGWKEVIIAGQRVPIVNYFMDGIIADITDIKEEVSEFDEVIVIGQQRGERITWEEACHKMNAYVDEQFQRITERVPKHYFY